MPSVRVNRRVSVLSTRVLRLFKYLGRLSGVPLPLSSSVRSAGAAARSHVISHGITSIVQPGCSRGMQELSRRPVAYLPTCGHLPNSTALGSLTGRRDAAQARATRPVPQGSRCLSVPAARPDGWAPSRPHREAARPPVCRLPRPQAKAALPQLCISLTPW